MTGYNGEAAVRLAEQYEALDFEDVHAAALPFLPKVGAAVLDIGSGSGRDAAWFEHHGYDVVAAEPSEDMRQIAISRHGSRVRWVNDRLPGLEAVHRLGLSFDLVWLSAVWMHVAPADRRRAFRKMITLLRPGGRLVMSLRHGASPEGRAMYETSRAEVEALAADHGAFVTGTAETADHLGRSEVQWETLVVRLVDDGTGALPLIRQIVLGDAKSSTYKLALLRTVARAADAAPGLAVMGDNSVKLPLGLIALYWVRMFLPLVKADLPQTPTSRKGQGLGFVRDGFRRLHDLAPPELRLGAVFVEQEMAVAVQDALRDAAATVAKMPAHYTTFPGTNTPVFNAIPERRRRAAGGVLIDDAFLWSYGSFAIPLNLWHALTRLNVWVEPALVAEWARLINRYLERQGRSVEPGIVAGCLEWLDPRRDTKLVRGLAEEMLTEGEQIYCVWSGTRLSERQMDIDHCFPFSSWPNGDAWNLLPASRKVNQHLKSDRLPSAELLRTAQDRIQDWWSRAYLRRMTWETRFWKEAQASLPMDNTEDMDDLYEAMQIKRILLRSTQQAQEWAGD